MFRFFHRHQKILMTTVAAMSAFSFCFYGLYSSFLGPSGPVDPIGSELADGTPVRQSRREALRRLLALEADMDMGRERRGFPNLINRGVITKSIIKAGLAPVVIERNQQQIHQEWRKILEEQQNPRCYRHPVRPAIGLKQAWGYAAPGLLALVEGQPTAIEQGFLEHQLAMLEAAEQCPAALTHQVLLGMERQARLPHDQSLDRAELRPFGHETLEDWFGPAFIEGCVDLVLEGAHAAQLAGQRVRAHDVRLAWVPGLNALKEQGVDAQNALRWLMASLNLSEGQAIDGWGQVLLFQQWLERALADAVKQDAALREQIVAAIGRAHETARVQVVSAPVTLQSPRELAQFECYLEGVGRGRTNPLDLPAELLSIDAVRRRAPELVSQRVQVVLKRVDREALMATMPVRAILQWQLSDEGWALLRNRVRGLAESQAASAQERRVAIQKLDASGRSQADQLAKESWLGANPQLLAAALEEAPAETLEWDLSAASLPGPLPGLPSSSTLLSWLGRQESMDVGFEGRTAFRVISMTALSEPRVLDYQSSVSSGALGALLQRRLREDWDLLKTAQDPLVAELRQPQEAEDRLLRRRLAKVTQALQEYVAQTLGKQLEGVEALAPFRLACYLTSRPAAPWMAEQFAATQSEQTVERGSQPVHRAFELAEGEWSLPFIDQTGVQRIQVLERSFPAGELDLNDEAAQPLLASVRAQLVRRFLTRTP